MNSISIRHPSMQRLIATTLLAGSISFSFPTLAADGNMEIRPISGPVTTIRLLGPVDLSLSQGETRGMRLHGTTEVRDKIKAEVSNGELRISYESSYSGWKLGSNTPALRAELAIPELRKLSVIGSGDVTLSAFDLKNGALEIEVTGSGDVKAERLVAKSLAVSIRGSGDVSAAGQVDTQSVDIAGSGDYSAIDLQSKTAAISIKGSGDARVWAIDTLSVSIAGSGDVRYKGQPKLSQSIHGSGEVSAQH